MTADQRRPAVRIGPGDDAERYLATDHAVWFHERPSAPPEVQLVALPPDRRFAAHVDGSDETTYAGVYGAYPMSLAVPGADDGHRLVPCSGLTFVGVHPDHRRQGVLTAMIRHHLEQVRGEDGTHVSALHASEPRIYGRFGYGLASLEHEVVVGRGTTFTAPHLDEAAAATTTRMHSLADPGMPELLERCHRATAELGTILGDPLYYQEVCRSYPEQMRDREPWRVLLARRDGADVGFAVFHRTQKWERSRAAGQLTVWTVVGDPATRLALMRRLVDFDLVGSVKLRAVGTDDPLLLWTTGGPRSTSDITTYDNLWVRLVDLPEALRARAWSEPCEVVVDVVDRHCPWNAGSWVIRAVDGAAEVERTTASPDVRLSVETLGAAYLGAGNLVAALQAGHVAEQRPGAAAELWRAMRTPVAPTAAWMF